jgi:hypothetical protein
MEVTLSRGRTASRIAAPAEALAVALDCQLAAVVRPPLHLVRQMVRQVRRRSIVSQPWSAEDALMVIVWVLIMPHAAARFEHDILVPPVGDLSAGATSLVASVAVLLELLVAAVLVQCLVRLCRTRRTLHGNVLRPEERLRSQGAV